MKKYYNFLLMLFLGLILVGCHKHSFKAEVTNPTCTEQGYTTYTCSCGKDTYVDNYVKALGHSYSEWKVIKEATETEKGLRERKCIRCSDKLTEEIPVLPHTHQYNETIIQPTCVDKGYTLYTCSCGDSYQDNEVDALGHTEEVLPKVEATCTDSGLTIGKKCSVCNTILVKQEEVKAKGHTESDWIINSEATCTNNGSKHKECSICKETLTTEVISSTGHSYKETITNPTCVDKGYTTYQCSKCDYTYKDNYTNELGHTEVILSKVDATCTKAGLTEGKKCSACNTILVKQEEIKALGHSYSEWTIIKESTETEKGLKERKCIICNDTEQQEIPVLSHEHNYTETVVAPTCEENGYILHICKCGDSYQDNYKDSLGHTESNWMIDIESTCTQNGKRHKECNRCKKNIKTEVIQLTGHSYKETITNPTCTTKGYTTFLCVKCNDIYKGNYTKTIDHIYSNQGNIVLLNDNTKAVNRYNCVNCINYKEEVYTGYYLDNSNAYYFNDLGNRITINEQFINYSGNTYYIINNIIVKNYYIIDGTIYDFGNDGIKQDKTFNEGFITINNKEYYVEENNKIATGNKIINDKVYNFGTNGVKQNTNYNNQFLDVNGNTYYIINNIIIKNYYIIDGTIYDFGNDGIKQDKTFNEGFITIDNKEYYVEENNKIATGNKIINDQVYDFGIDGVKQNTNYSNQFLDVNGNTYYIINNIIIKNYYIIDGTIYDFGNDGIKQDILLNEKIVEMNNNKYYVLNNVIQVNTYILYNQHMYYFDNNGCALVNATYNNHNYGSNGYIVGNDILIKINDILYDVNKDIVTLHIHKITHIEYKEKTCTKDGNKEYYYCTKCDKYYLDNTYINEVSKEDIIIKASHNLTHYEEKQPTCTEEGYKAYDKCNDCTFSTFESLSIINCISSDWIIDTDATCTEKGSKHKECTMCKKVLETEEIKAKGHNYIDGKCSMCGKQNSSANEIVIDNGYIYFGEYPQTLKEESVTVSTTPDSDGYYLGSDGERYAEVEAKPWDSSYVFNDKTTSIVKGNTYYFKVEPIKWKIEEESNGTYKLISTIILDNQMYYSSSGNRTIDGQTIYANNYEYSDIRKWLNNDFLNKAFTKKLQTYIATSMVDNSLTSTGDSSNKYICNNTLDKIYLPSVEEMTNTSYGYDGNSSRRKQLTDYAKALGCYMYTSSSYYNNGHYWLRSPYFDFSNFVRFVIDFGYISSDYVSLTNVGVAPALSITIK